MALIAAALIVVVEAPVCVSISERSALSRSAVTTTVDSVPLEVEELKLEPAAVLAATPADTLLVRRVGRSPVFSNAGSAWFLPEFAEADGSGAARTRCCSAFMMSLATSPGSTDDHARTLRVIDLS